MVRRMLNRLAKWRALRSYRARLPRLLVERYGRERHYTPPQVLTTIKLHRLSERFAPYACALFCSKRGYADFLASHVPKTELFVEPLDNSLISLWAMCAIEHWPVYDAAVTDIGDAYWDQHAGHLGRDHLAHYPSDVSDRHHGGVGGHDGSHHGGAGGDGSHHGGAGGDGSQ
jgi:hypothetical protein